MTKYFFVCVCVCIGAYTNTLKHTDSMLLMTFQHQQTCIYQKRQRRWRRAEPAHESMKVNYFRFYTKHILYIFIHTCAVVLNETPISRVSQTNMVRSFLPWIKTLLFFLTPFFRIIRLCVLCCHSFIMFLFHTHLYIHFFSYSY